LGAADLDRVLRARLPEISEEERVVLGRLAKGCPGQALDLAARGGLELQDRLSGLLKALPEIDLGRIHALGDSLARSGADADFRTVGELLTDWLAARAKAAGGHRAELETWLGLWEKVSRLFGDAERYNLDRKQVLLNAFAALQHAQLA
jgi:DNA polymerase-3 subunit delta'